MKATNFDESMLAKINDVLKFVLENPHSDFYRKKYGENPDFYPVKSYEDFEKIPFLTKDEFLSVKVENRIFVPENEVIHYSFSSGTTGNPIPTIIPHSSHYYEGYRKYMLNDEVFKKIGLKKTLLLLQPSSTFSVKALSLPNPPSTFMAGNIYNLNIMAKIGRELSIDSIVTMPTVLDSYIAELSLLKDFDWSSIKWISLGSEFCSTLRLEYFKKQFPAALFHFRYGNTEIGGLRHYRCQHLENKLPNIFHIDNEKEFLEITNEQGQTLSDNETGEIIHTDLIRKAFPLIRYKLKDMGAIHKISCPCENNITLKIDGKANFDVLKLHGTTVHAEMISQAVKKIQDVVEPHFQMHIFEKNFAGKPKPQLNLHLKLRNKYKNSNKDEFLLAILKEKISTNLQISSTMNLSDLVSKGIFLPLEITYVSTWPQEKIKFKNIVSHIE